MLTASSMLVGCSRSVRFLTLMVMVYSLLMGGTIHLPVSYVKLWFDLVAGLRVGSPEFSGWLVGVGW